MTAVRRVVLWCVGLVVFSVGIGLTIWSNWGVGSVDLAVTGVVARTGVHLRLAVIVVHASAVLCAIVLGERLRWPTVVASAASSLLIGLSVDVLAGTGVDPGDAAPAVCAAGVALLGIGAGAQITAAVGPSPFEMLSVAIARHTGGIASARTIAEICLAAAGIGLGGQLGWGTLMGVATTGTVIGATCRFLGPRLGASLSAGRTDPVLS